MKLTTTIFINNDTSNPIHATCIITGDYSFPRGWDYEIELKAVELVIADKVGIDITRQVMSNARAKAHILSQVENEEEQIIEALDEKGDENVQIDDLIERNQNK